MPFKSKAQQGWMFEHKPKMAKKWAGETPDIASLPDEFRAKKIALQKLMSGGSAN